MGCRLNSAGKAEVAARRADKQKSDDRLLQQVNSDTAQRLSKSEADAKYAADMLEYEQKLAAQRKAVADFEAARRQMAANKAAAAARAAAARQEFAQRQAAYQAEQDRYAREQAEYEAKLQQRRQDEANFGTMMQVISGVIATQVAGSAGLPAYGGGTVLPNDTSTAAPSTYPGASTAQEEYARQQAAYEAQLTGQPGTTQGGGTLPPLSTGGPQAKPVQEGEDARVIASNGKPAMDCVKLIQVTDSDSSLGGGGRVLSNQCSDEVEIAWCYTPGDCETETGSSWTVQPGKSWPVSAEKQIRWVACHGRDTASFVKGSYGLRYICKAPN